MKLIKILSLSLLAFTLLAACNKDEKSCPGSKTEFTVGNGKIYVPNIFTSNGDGINDVFYVFSDTNIVSIKDLKIKNGKGNTIFERENEQFPNTSSWSIDSYKGRFSYSFEAKSSDGTSANVSGHALSFPGDKKLDCDGCQFPTQHDGYGRFNDGLPTLESNIDCK
jgi:CHU_C Type IX secretion signal domain